MCYQRMKSFMQRVRQSEVLPNRVQILRTLFAGVVFVGLLVSIADMDKTKVQNIKHYNLNFNIFTSDFERHFILSPKFKNGSTIIEKDVTKFWKEPLKKWNPQKETLMYLHIPKTGGTTFDFALKTSYFPEKQCNMSCTPTAKALLRRNRKCPNVTNMFCNQHFDWTIVREAQRIGVQPQPIVLFRDPIKRAVSHFYFVLDRGNGRRKLNLPRNLSLYLQDEETLMKWRRMWHDGEATVHWLAGTQIYMPIYKRLFRYIPNFTLDDVRRRDATCLDWTRMLDVALDNLHKCLWIGILEKMDQSLEMFEYQTGLKLKFGKMNENTKKYPEPTRSDIETLKKLMPVDIYIYEYIKLFFDNRWRAYLREKFPQKKLVIFPENLKVPETIHGCRSTTKGLLCPDDIQLFLPNRTHRVFEPWDTGYGSSKTLGRS